jgi:hypothetical protein
MAEQLEPNPNPSPDSGESHALHGPQQVLLEKLLKDPKLAEVARACIIASLPPNYPAEGKSLAELMAIPITVNKLA